MLTNINMITNGNQISSMNEDKVQQNNLLKWVRGVFLFLV